MTIKIDKLKPVILQHMYIFNWQYHYISETAVLSLSYTDYASCRGKLIDAYRFLHKEKDMEMGFSWSGNPIGK